MKIDVDLPNYLSWLDPSQCDRRTISVREPVFRQGDPTTGFYHVLGGTIHLVRVTASGHEIVLHCAVEGHTFAEASIFAPVYHCDAIAVQRSRIFRVPKDLVLARFAKDPHFAMTFARHFARQVQDYRILHEIRGIHSAPERVMAAMEAGVQASNWKALAAQIGLSHESVYRALSLLSKSGRVEKIGRGQFNLKRST